jgi:hypothetical protein
MPRKLVRKYETIDGRWRLTGKCPTHGRRWGIWMYIAGRVAPDGTFHKRQMVDELFELAKRFPNSGFSEGDSKGDKNLHAVMDKMLEGGIFEVIEGEDYSEETRAHAG